MFKTLRRRRFLAAFASAVTAVSAISAMQASCADPVYPKIVVLGDSISAGTGLDPEELNYGHYLSEMFDGDVTNYAVSGLTTDGMLTKLEQASVQKAVKEADLICLSIGSNDVLKPTMDYFATLRQEGERTMDMLTRIAQSSSITFYIGQLTSTLREPIAHAKENMPKIEKALRELNPDAPIVAQTIYNPFEMSQAELSEKSDAAKSNYSDFISYVNGQESKINDSIKAMSSCKTADVYNAFKGSGWMYTNSDAADVHPNGLGHALISSLIAEQIGRSSVKFERFGRLLYEMPAADYAIQPAKNRTLLNAHAIMPQLTFGDTDLNGYITLEDAISALQSYTNTAIQKTADLTPVGGVYAADVNSDGELTLEDAITILQYYTKKSILREDASWYELTHNPKAPDAPSAQN